MEDYTDFEDDGFKNADTKTQREFVNYWVDTTYADDEEYQNSDDATKLAFKESMAEEFVPKSTILTKIGDYASDTLEKARTAVGLKKDIPFTTDDLKYDENFVDLTPKEFQDPLHTMPQTKEEALSHSNDFAKQQKSDEALARLEAEDKPLEDTTLDFAFAGAGGVRALQGVGAKAFAKTAPQTLQAEKMIVGGQAFAVGDIAGNVVASGVMKVANDSMDDNFKEEYPLLSALIVMGAGLATGGVAGYKAEKQVMQKYNKMVEEVSTGKVKPQDAETILKEDGFNANEYLSKTSQPKISDELDQIDVGFKELEVEINGGSTADDALVPKGFKEPEATSPLEELPNQAQTPPVETTPQQTLQSLQSDITQANRKADFEESVDNVVGATKLREEAKLLEEQANTTRVEMTSELLKHPRAEELLEMRKNVSAKESKSAQTLLQKGAGRELDGYGGENKQAYDNAQYGRNYNHDFEMTKKDVQDLLDGKTSDDLIAKLETDLGTLDNHPDYAPTPKDELPPMSDADWDEANAMFSKGIDNVAVGVYAGVETDENGNFIGIDAEKFVLGLGGYTAVKAALKNKTVQGKLKDYAQKAIDTVDMNPAVSKPNGLNAMFVGSKPDTNYRMSHSAPEPTSDFPNNSGYNVEDIFPNFYNGKALQNYRTGLGRNIDNKSIDIIKSLEKKPESKVTIYRTVPKNATADTIFSGDWITINKDYAKEHGEHSLKGDYKILKKEVKAEDIFNDGDSIHEWGYHPKEEILPYEKGSFSDVATKKSMYEIDDSGAKLKIDKTKATSLDDILEHPELFKEYPKLSDTKVSFVEMPKNQSGYFDTKTNEISINSNSNQEEIKTILLHEIQHNIQTKEGWARGGNTENLKPKDLAETLKLKYGNIPSYSNIEIDFLNSKIATEDEMYVKMINLSKDNYGGIDALKFDTYKRLHGEQQARATQYRVDMTPEQKASETWQDTLKRVEGEYKEPIVRFDDGGVSEMSPVKSKTQKEKRGIYNVQNNGKNSTNIYKDDEFAENYIKYEQGKADYVDKNGKAKNGFGALHINKHIGKDKNGWVTQPEILNIGEAIRNTKPVVSKQGRRMYEYHNNDNVRFRVVVGDKKNGERTISFFSNRKVGFGNDSQDYIYNQPLNRGDKLAEKGIKLNTEDPVAKSTSPDAISAQGQDSTRLNKELEPHEIYGEDLKGEPSVSTAKDGTFSSPKTSNETIIPQESKKLQEMQKKLKEENEGVIKKLFNKYRTGQLKEVGSLPEETQLQLVQRNMQDKFNRVKQLINVKADIKKIDDHLNPYQAEENMHGKISAAIDDFETDTFNPIIEKISRGKVFEGTKDARSMTTDDVDLYLWARHAGERNKKMLEQKLDAIPKSTMSDDEIAKTLAKYKDTEIKDILKALKKDANAPLGRFTQEHITTYVNAIEAQKINKQIAKTKTESSSLSGMSDEEASIILQRYSTSESMQSVVSGVYKMNRDRLRYIMDEGLESETFVRAIESNYDNYVPLRREFEDSAELGKGAKGFDINGKEFKKAKGSQRKVESPLLHSAMAYQETIMRAEKNKVGKAFLNFVKEFPDEKLYSLRDAKVETRLDEFSGAVTSESSTTKLKDDVLHVKVDGKIKEIIIHDKALAIAMKNLNAEQLKGIVKASHTVTRFIASMNTMYNPEFVVSNFTRDIQSAMINLPDNVKGNSLNIMKEVPSAMKAIYKQNRSKNGAVNDEWQKLFYEMKREGGTTGWSESYSVPNLKKSTKTMIDAHRGKFLPKESFKSVLKYVDDINDVVENSVRLVAYKMAKESDLSKAKSASIAKNLTVNFNRKGELGTNINAFYMFYNASIQGSARMIKQLGTSRKAQLVVAGMAGAGYGLDLWNRKQNAEAYALVPQYVKDTNYVLMNEDGTYETVKLPYGYNLFKSMGDVAGAMQHGELTLSDLPSRMLSVSVNAFSPIGVDAEDPIHTITPTIIKPFYEIFTNQNFFGGNIAPSKNPFASEGADASNYFKSVNPVAKTIATGLNSVTGGTLHGSGSMDISPESIEHIGEFGVGGLGKLIGRTITTADSLLSGEDVDMNKVPFSRLFYQTPREKAEVSKVYSMYNKSGSHKFSDVETRRFKKWADAAKKKKHLDPGQYRKIVSAFNSNQKVLVFEKKWDIQTKDDYMTNTRAQRDANRNLTHQERKIIMEK